MNQIDAYLIHGIGREVSKDYYNKFVSGVRKYLPLDADIVWHGINYSMLLEKREKQIFSWMKKMNGPLDIASKRAREFACNYVCDVLAYGWPKREPTEGDFIFDLHAQLKHEFAKARPGAKKVIIGHSLGSIVGYGFTWEEPTNCLIVMGSPFSYFSIRYKNGGEMNPDLPQFHNFWRGRDLVSTIISENPKFRAVHDYEVTSFNPRYLLRLQAHSMYWTSDFVHKKIARILQIL